MTKRDASEAAKLRREIGGRRSRRGPLRRALRERGKAFAQARSASGATAATIAAEIGVSEMTVERWLGRAASASIVPVRVVDASRAAPTKSMPIVTTPSGLRIECLDLDAICTLIMRCG